MSSLRFLSRVAFFCNIFFGFTLLLKRTDYISDPVTASYIIILGYFLAVVIFNPIVNISYLFCLFTRKNLFGEVPRWLVVANVLFLLLQIVYIIFFLNDPVYT